MSNAGLAASAASPTTQPQLSGGLILKGTVIAVRTEEKEWEKEKYVQTTIEVSDGEQVYSIRIRHGHDRPEIPKLFSQVMLRVTYAATEKGKITVKGIFV